MEVVALLYPPFVILGTPAAWPPKDEQPEVLFRALAHVIPMTLPHPQTGQPVPVIQVNGLGDWPLRNKSWASAGPPTEDQRRAYGQWRAQQAGIQLAGADDPLLKQGVPRGPHRVR